MMNPSLEQIHPAGSLKVLFLTSWYPDRRNPVGGVFIREHARAVHLYDDVIVLHLPGADHGLKGAWKIEQEHDENLILGIPTYRVQYRPSPIPHTSILLSLMSAFYAFLHLRRAGFQPEVLHAHIHRAGLPAIMLGKLFKIPVVVTEHNSAFPRKMLRTADIRIARYTFSRAACVLTVSNALQQGIQDLGIRANFQTVPNAVDTALFSPGGRASSQNSLMKLLFVGSLVPVKGVTTLFQALSLLQKQDSNWQLDILGDGPERMAYQRQADELGLASQIIFYGARPKTEVASFMRNADLFILPSLWENLPCVLLEAMASGLPILSTRAGGIPEIVSPESGLLVQPGDAEALHGGLSQMLSSLSHFNRSQIATQAQRYSLQAVGRQIHSIYQNLLSG